MRAVVIVLALGVLLQGWLAFASRPTHRTLPIFVPATLEMERAMRKERGQPAGRGGEEAVLLAQALLEGAAPVAATRIERLRALRSQLLDARNRRHALNIALMDVGAEVGQALTGPQWDAVHMRRDQLRKDGDEAVFERLLRRLQGG